MSGYLGSTSWALEDGTLLTQDVQTPHGSLERVYYGTGCVYAIAEHEANSEALYALLREELGAVKLTLYVQDKGRYDAPQASYGPLLTDEALDEDILATIHRFPSVYSERDLEQMQRRLLDIDARTRGFYRSEDGTLYLYRHGQFFEASHLDGDELFRLCLFGGIFGLHRFAMGKWLSGLIYVLTCGFFLFGWLMDLLQILGGFQRDKHKCLVPPVSNRGKKFLSVLPAALVGCIVFSLYLTALSALSGSGSTLPPDMANRLVNILQRIVPTETLK